MTTLTLRATKGSPLTTAEMDGNLSNLNTDKLEDADITFTLLNGNGLVGTGAAQVAQGNHSHGSTYEVVDPTILRSADIGSTVQGYDADTVKYDVSGSFTAEQTFKEVGETVYSLTGTVINPANGTIQYKTLSGNTTFTESLVSGQSVTLLIDDGAGYTITWPTMQWAGGAAPTLPTSGYAVIELFKVSSTLYGVYVGDMS